MLTFSAAFTRGPSFGWAVPRRHLHRPNCPHHNLGPAGRNRAPRDFRRAGGAREPGAVAHVATPRPSSDAPAQPVAASRAAAHTAGVPRPWSARRGGGAGVPSALATRIRDSDQSAGRGENPPRPARENVGAGTRRAHSTESVFYTPGPAIPPPPRGDAAAAVLWTTGRSSTPRRPWARAWGRGVGKTQLLPAAMAPRRCRRGPAVTAAGGSGITGGAGSCPKESAQWTGGRYRKGER